MEELFNFSLNIIQKANLVILKNLSKTSKISYKKGDFNLVTNVDHEVEALILKEITSKYPLSVFKNPYLVLTLLKSLLGSRLSSLLRNLKWKLNSKLNLFDPN